MTHRQALTLLRKRGELLLVRGHWCVPVQEQPPEVESVLPVAVGIDLIEAGLAVVDGDKLRPA